MRTWIIPTDLLTGQQAGFEFRRQVFWQEESENMPANKIVSNYQANICLQQFFKKIVASINGSNQIVLKHNIFDFPLQRRILLKNK